jgi:CHAT domain-containing protein
MKFSKSKAVAAFTLLLALTMPSWRFAQPGSVPLLPLLEWETGQTQAQVTTPEQVGAIAKEAALTTKRAEQLMERGRYDEAIAQFQAAIQLYQQLPPASIGSSIRDCREGIAKALLLKGDNQKSLVLLKEIAAERQAQKDTSVAFTSLLALAYFQTENYPEAEQIARKVVNYWETLVRRSDNNDRDRITLADQLSYTYRLLQKALVAQNKTDAALEVAELSRARALVELLSQRGKQPSQSPTLQQLRQIARIQNSTLVMYSIVGREMRVLNIEPRDETDLYIWVIQPAGNIYFHQVNLKAAGLTSLKDTVLATRERALGVRGRGLGVVAADNLSDRGNPTSTTQPFLRKLYALLVQPIAAQLPSDPNASVTFIPESSLVLVPFAALQNANGKYLIEQHTLRISPSIQVLALTKAQQERKKAQNTSLFAPDSSLIVGNPTMPSLPPSGEALPPLPGAEREARAIADIFKTTPLLGNQATKQAVLKRLPQAQLIHLATHGLLDLDANLNEFGELTVKPATTARDSGVFLGPGVLIGPNVFINGVPASVAAAREGVNLVEIPGTLALAPTQGNNGFLSAKEILTLQLNADLVVLSACDTGRGRITGDGAVGLSRAFIGAGVPSVIVSLWSVPDAPTAALMTEFYQNLKQRRDRAQALRQAMLTTLKQYPAPRDWAAFTLIGEAE